MQTTTLTDARGRFSLGTVWPEDPPEKWVYMVARSPAGLCTWKTAPLCGGADVSLRFRPEASVHGRLVNHAGQPLGGAPVWLYLGQDAQFGDVFFYNKMRDLAPQAVTAADGTFTLRGLPSGSTVSITAKHPDYQPAQEWHTRDVQLGTTVKDLVADDGITVAGTVRMAGSQQPVAGASVDLVAEDEPLATVVSDAQGKYRFAGVDHWWVRGKFGVSARLGAGPDWEGSAASDVSLYPGDSKTDLDVVVGRSFAVRQAEWLRQKGIAPPCDTRIAVVDGLDPQSKHLNAVTLYDHGSTVASQHGQMDFAGSWECRVATNPVEHTFYLYNSDTGQMSGFDPTAKLLWQRRLGDLNAVAVDPATGNLWTLKTNGLIYGDGATVFSPNGDRLHDLKKISGAAIAYSAHDRCFWVCGQRLIKVGLDGKVLLEAPISFGWLARDLAVNPTDGSVWVAESAHPDERQSNNRLYIVAPDGQVGRQIELGEKSPGRIELDPARATAWMQLGDETARLSIDGDIQLLIPARGDLCVEPDTGCPWADESLGVRFTPYVLRH